MIIEETTRNLKDADIARLHETFFGSADTPAATEFLQHLDKAQTAIANGSNVSGSCAVPLKEMPMDFKITPALARDCRQLGIGIEYEGVDRHGYISGADMERMCEDPNVCATDPKLGNMVGRLSDMPAHTPITSVPGDTLTLQAAGNKTIKIPVEFSDKANSTISERMQTSVARHQPPKPAPAVQHS